MNGRQKQISAWYKRFGSSPVEDDLGRLKELKIVRGQFVDKTTLYRHDPDRLARVIVKLL
jgi:hypothetical protein